MAPSGRILAGCAGLYLVIYALEAPIRYFLYLHGRDNLILARDGLIFGSLAALIALQVRQLKLPPAFVVFGALAVFHSLVLVGTTGSILGSAYGLKITANLLFGFFVASALLTPGKILARLLVLIWLVTLVGLCLDKFVVTFPWTGIKTVVGDLTVDVSKDWQVQGELTRRAAGFARSSIATAALIPPLAIILMCRARHWLLRGGIALLSLGAVFLTTQKGALFAFVPFALLLAARPRCELLLCRASVLAFAVSAVALPIMTIGLHLAHGAGVFSTESLALRISDTWPRAWTWIARHQMLVFGVGLGGIGGPQRIYAPGAFDPADNLFILLYAYFGVFSGFYIAAVLWLVFRRITGSPDRVVPALAILGFLCGYGVVLSVIEDQSAALFLGAAIGVLAQKTSRTRKAPQTTQERREPVWSRAVAARPR